jgi:Tol biopolymer transport system component
LDERWRRIEELYHAALEQPPHMRVQYLERACSSDDELRREVESLLAADGKASDFLDNGLLSGTAAPTVPLLLLGNYQILSPLGAGGMGEVYRAHDRKLGRDVAIKTLPWSFASDANRLARFRREARILASLNHPNIAAIYGLEEGDGPTYLILELVEGDTLKERLERSGPLPVTQALKVSLQIAEALEAAHSKGIIHRDLKPANVKITAEGRVKVLDFGLAKAMSSDDTPTFTEAGPGNSLQTMTGAILGTPSYMSPEQARGEVADKRSDVWSFGCLLYELLAGKRVFQSDSAPDALNAVLKKEPDWQAIPAGVPEKVRTLLRNCLRKNPELRPEGGAEIRKTLEESAVHVRARFRPMHAGVAAGFLGLVAFGALRWYPGASPRVSPSEWVQITNFPDSVTQPAVSPDGKMLTFVRGGSTFMGPGEIYVKALPYGEPVQLTHDRTPKMHPIFSPDGSRIAYSTLGPGQGWDTWTVPVFGGTAKPWLTNASGLSWTGQGQLLFSEIKSVQRMAIVESPEERTGGHDVYMPPTLDGMAHRSYLSPDGKSVLIVEMADSGAWLPCRLVPLDGRSAGKTVGPGSGGCTAGAWSPDGSSIYLSVVTEGNSHIWRQHIPGDRAEQITSGTTAEEGIAVAPDGHSLITAVGAQQRTVIVRDIVGERQASLEGYAYMPKLSTEGKKVFFRIARGTGILMPFRGTSELWETDLGSGRTERLIPELLVTGYDVASDGRMVVTANDSAGVSHLWLASGDSRIPPRMVPNTEGAQNPFFAAPGELLYLNPRTAYLIREDGTGRRSAASVLDEIHRVSPDYRWLIGTDRDSKGTSGVAISLTGESASVKFGPFWPAWWSPDGKYFFLSAMDAQGSAGAYGRTYAIPLKSGKMLPDVPSGGFHNEQEIAALPGARLVPGATADFAPGPSLDTYAYSRISSQRNLYRIPLP